jgi:hypothetical protein
MFVHRIFTEGIFSSQYLTNELQLWTTVDDYSFVVVEMEQSIQEEPLSGKTVGWKSFSNCCYVLP